MYPILFTLNGWPVYTYGFFAALAFALWMGLIVVHATMRGWPGERHFDIIFLGMIAGVFGARLLNQIATGEFLTAPGRFFSLNEGGLSFFGGFFFALAVIYGLVIHFGFNFWESIDLYALMLIPALAVARLGCFFRGCCHGFATSPPFGLELLGPGQGTFFPVQLLFTLSGFIAFGWLYPRYKSPPPAGVMAGLAFGFLGAQRFVLEFLRGDNPGFWGFSAYHPPAFLLMTYGFWIYFRRRGVMGAGDGHG